MLTHPTLDRLNALGLHGMAKAFADIEAAGEAGSLGHAEWLALLLEREASLRHDKRLATRLRYAKLRQQACVEDIDYCKCRFDFPQKRRSKIPHPGGLGDQPSA
ncbi:DNA replication protein DnaC [Bradyrhizobium sp. USDA 4471]